MKKIMEREGREIWKNERERGVKMRKDEYVNEMERIEKEIEEKGKKKELEEWLNIRKLK